MIDFNSIKNLKEELKVSVNDYANLLTNFLMV
jgi:hypothetical protein